MSSSPVEPADLLDLKLLPAWVKEPREARNYERYTGEEESGTRRAGRDAPRGKHPKRRTPMNRKQASNFDKPRADIQHPPSTADRRHRDGLRRKRARPRTSSAQGERSPLAKSASARPASVAGDHRFAFCHTHPHSKMS